MGDKTVSSEDSCRADYRLISYILRIFVKGVKVIHDPAGFDQISKAFARGGGSWERLFKGSSADFNLLRKLVKLSIKLGILKKQPRFR